jgi:hypothetical protein
MYFRFVISYLHAKKADNSEYTERVEGKEHFWASPGNYLRHVYLARNISGLELPPSVYCDTTFNDDN